LDLERDRLFERDRERRDLDRLRERDLRLEWDRLRDRERDDRLCRDLDLDLKRCFSNSRCANSSIHQISANIKTLNYYANMNDYLYVTQLKLCEFGFYKNHLYISLPRNRLFLQCLLPLVSI